MKDNISSALDVADYIVNIPSEEGGSNISHLKLQKLLFYCQAFHLASTGKPLFKEDVVAWSYGPVVKEVFSKYEKYGNSIIPVRELSNGEKPPGFKISAKGISIISSVMEAYGHLSAISLMERTHREPPWMEAFEKGEDKKIDHASMKKYYKKQLN